MLWNRIVFYEIKKKFRKGEKEKMLRDHYQIILAFVGCFVMSFCLYVSLYKHNPLIWVRASITGLIFFAFYFHCFKDCSNMIRRAKTIYYKEIFKDIK